MQQDTQYLVDMLHSVQRILELTGNCSIQSFYADVRLQDAAMVELLAIGKSARRISEETRQDTRDIDWPAIARLKSQLAGKEQTIDADRLWAIIQTTVPKLSRSLSLQVLADNFERHSPASLARP